MSIFTKLFSGNKKSFEDDGGYTLVSSDYSYGKLENNDKKLLELYKSTVFAACDSIGDGLAGTPMILYKDNTKQDILKHDYLDFFNYETKKAVAIFLKTLGAIYLYKETVGNKIVNLLLLDPQKMSVKSDEFGRNKKYTYATSDGVYSFKKEDIIELKTFSPIFSKKGMTPLKAVASQVATDLASVQFNKTFFENGGKPGTIIKHKMEIDENVRNKYIAKFKKEFMGPGNAGKVMFADNGIEVEALGISNKEMENVAQRQFTQEEVLMMFRVGKPILGKSDGVGFADRKVPEHYFITYALKPLATQIEEKLNKELFNEIGFVEFQFPIDKEELLQEYQANLITRNQYLIATGKKPFKNGNVFWDGTEGEVEQEKKEVKFDEKLEKSIAKSLTKSFEKIKKENTFGTDEYNQKLWDSKIARTDKYEVEFESIQKKIWNIQAREIKKQLEGKKSIKTLKEKDLIDEKKSILQYLTMYSPFFKKFMKVEGEISIEEISEEAFAISKLNKWIGERIEKMSKDIDEVTRKEMFAIIKQGNRDKLGAAQIVANINKQFSLYSKKKGRVENISRTEITRASNKSQLEAFKQSGVVEKKQWFTAADERRCQYCENLHGKTIKLGDPFLKLGTTHLGQKIEYETVEFPPRHPRCRCVARPIISMKTMKQVQEIMLKKGTTLIINK